MAVRLRFSAWTAISVGLFAVGLGSLLLTAYLWFGNWPKEAKEIVDHYRSVAASADQVPLPLIANVRTRDARSLNGTWQAVIDPRGVGTLAGIAARAAQPRDPSGLTEFSFGEESTLEVPGDWNTQDPRLFFYEGRVWYRRSFEYAASPGSRIFLWFGAANYRASVFVNGLHAGSHEGGFTPFNLEVTGQLRPGENQLVVLVDNSRGPEDIPPERTDWHNYGGLTRDVLLVVVPETFIRDYRVALAKGSRDRIAVEVDLDGPRPEQAVRVEIPDLEVDTALRTDARGRGRIEVDAAPELWSPDSPRLYPVTLRAETDAVSDAIGFRTIEVEGTELLLNGAPVFLRGISIHEEVPVGDGRAHSPEHAARLLGWARELEANFVRLAHYPHNEHMVRLADRMGLLVWEEIPVYWGVAFDSPLALERAERHLGEMISRDRNRASVILWSIGNETPVNEARQAFMGELARHVRSMDPSRPVSGAMVMGAEASARMIGFNLIPAALGWRRAIWAYRVSDPLSELVDLPALNEYFGWYDAAAIGLLTPLSSRRARRLLLDNLDRIRIETGVHKPLLVSEFGAGAKAGLHAAPEELVAFSEEYQALFYRRQLAMLGRQPDLCGISPWVLRDFRSPLRLYHGVQDYWNRKGLISERGEKKLAFDVLRDHYRTLKRSAAVSSG